MRKLIIPIIAVGFIATGCLKKQVQPATPADKPKAVKPSPADEPTKKKKKKKKPRAESAVPAAGELDFVLLRPATGGKVTVAPIRGRAFFDKPGGKKVTRSVRCSDKGARELWYCANDRWFAGENRGTSIEHPNPGTRQILSGTDLGISVQFGPEDRTIYYMGDTMGKWARRRCGVKAPNTVCNDAILIAAGPEDEELPLNPDPDRGIATAVVVDRKKDGKVEGFVPIVIDGINGEDPLPFCKDLPRKDLSPCLAAFNVPSGAITVRLARKLLPGAKGGVKGTAESVLMWYTTAGAVFLDKINKARGASFLAVSTDGAHFEKIIEKPFSRDKFIEVAPVQVRKETLKDLCRRDAKSPLCAAELGPKGDILLMFGTGEKYRKSPLYLGVLRLSDLKPFYYRHDATSGVESWSTREEDATPIIGRRGKHNLATKLLGKGKSRPVNQFGELSAKLVPRHACPVKAMHRCEDTIVVLANQAGSVHYRTVPLAHPGRVAAPGRKQTAWTEPKRTSGAGYGPYIIDAYTEVEPGKGGGLRLKMYHVISSWDGRKLDVPGHNPYGVFTRQLKLVDEASCKGATKAKMVCEEHPPPWPPE